MGSIPIGCANQFNALRSVSSTRVPEVSRPRLTSYRMGRVGRARREHRVACHPVRPGGAARPLRDVDSLAGDELNPGLETTSSISTTARVALEPPGGWRQGLE